MVNGVDMVFRKERMLQRVKAAGLSHLVGAKEIAIMDNLDGQPVSTAAWNRQVNDQPVFSCLGKDGKYYDVHEDDCEAV